MAAASRFAGHSQGVAAVEFALVAPVLILIYFGCTEVAISLSTARKAYNLTGQINDLVSQSTSLTSADIKRIFAITKPAMAPYDSTKLNVKTTSIYVDGDGKATVDWSCGNTSMGASKKGDPVALPSQTAQLRNAYLLKTQTRYDYSPLSGMVYSGTVDLGGTSYISPRYSDSVSSTGCASF